ncbi:hypothetical protein ASG65_02285 [Bacillus sp. Leaf13]|nr:hypothetical protein ASG65_02285 [Bacillus sp. Leaf13]KRF61939.1 hypothetical protein ASG99_05930 [Bacillus sp. Soil768D1]
MPTMGYKSPIFLKYLIGFQFHWIIPPLLPVFFSSEKKKSCTRWGKSLRDDDLSLLCPQFMHNFN